jgi:hypothetical protein
MQSRNFIARFSGVALVSAALLLGSTSTFAHCDGVDGPVVKAARQALASGDPKPVLIWVQKDDEAEIKGAFRHALEVRRLSPAAKELADHYFFETLVRVHRAGEGAPYTGIKPAGRALNPAVAAGDKALESRSIEPVLHMLTASVQDNVRERYETVMARKNFDKGNVAAGQQYVKAYVEYIHAVERIHDASAGSAHGHERAEADAHSHQH